MGRIMAEKPQNHKASAPDACAAHYDTLLAEHYSWMMGDFAERVDDHRRLFAELGLVDGAGEAAIDLGCGSGFQSIALAGLGYAVQAVDGCGKLLAELDRRKGALHVMTLCHDIRDIRAVARPGARLIVCMGDTLPHLAGTDEIDALFADVRALLAPGGSFVVGFRDQSVPLTGTDRFLPLRSDENRIMTCFLEYEPEFVRVHDLVHVRTEDGWELHKSCYCKLRLGADGVCARLKRAGLSLRARRTFRGMDCLVADRVDSRASLQ